MLVVELQKTDGTVKICRMPEHPFEVQAGRFIQYMEEVVSRKPDSLKRYEEALEKEKPEILAEIGDSEINGAWVPYYAEELAFWLGLSPEDAGELPVDALDHEFNVFGLRAILQRAFNVEPLDEYIEYFELKGVKYYTPETGAGLKAGQAQPFQKVTVGEYATAMELNRALARMEGGEIDGLLHMVAVLCRKKGEQFPLYASEQSQFIKERVKLFYELDLETLMRVGFFLVMQSGTSREFSAIYREMAAAAAQLRRQNMAFIQ